MKTPLRFSVLSSFCFLSLWLMIAPAQAQTTRFVSTTGTNTNPASATSWARHADDPIGISRRCRQLLGRGNGGL